MGGIELPVFSLSAAGTLTYVHHEAWTDPARLVWVDREHNVTPVEGQPLPAQPGNFSLSRDGRTLTFQSQGIYDIWTYDLEQGVLNQITTYPGFDGFPIWADGDRRIIFSSARSGEPYNLWSRSADGMGEAEEILPFDPEAAGRYPMSWSTNGVLAYLEPWDIWLLPMDGDRTPLPFRATEASESGAQFSPDGDLLAYHTNERETWEVYVEPVPQTGEIIKVSTGGGVRPFWSADGTQLFFTKPGAARTGLLGPGGGRQVFVAQIHTEPELRNDPPELFFERPESVEAIWPFETSQGFLGFERDPSPEIRQVKVVLNFSEELRRLDPTEQ
jgi:Tol biopolymer transport system component